MIFGRRQDPTLAVVAELRAALALADQRYEALLDRYHALRVSGANPKEPEKPVPAPEQPPEPVLRAMRVISPTNDPAFAANWRLWEQHKEEAKADPEAFAERIKRGRLSPDVQGPRDDADGDT